MGSLGLEGSTAYHTDVALTVVVDAGVMSGNIAQISVSLSICVPLVCLRTSGS